MIRSTLLIVVFILFLSGFSQAQSKLTHNSYALTNGHIIDHEAEEIFDNSTILISDGKVELILQAGSTIPSGYEVIDLEGKYVMSGYIDAHTHLNSLSSADRALRSGVTTVRSSSVPFFQDVAIKNLVDQNYLPGPDMIPAGIFVTPDLGESILADPELAALFDGVTTEEALRKLVQINVERGAEFIKTRGTERAGLPNTDPRKQTYSEDQLRIVVEEAAKYDVPIQIHGHGDEGSYAAVSAGARSIEHGTYLSDKTLDLMVQKGTYFVPTYSTVYDLTQPGGDYDNPVLRNRGRHMLPELGNTVQRAREKGVKIVTGADTGYGPNSMTRISHEMTFYVELGFSPYEAIRSATTVAAELLRIENKTGQLKPGYEADLVVLNSNPIEDMKATQDVILVMSNGHMVFNRLPFQIID
ncbi:MAG: amidohydrolase family protein [Gracilimonas sp.]|nr:amidohydrolase family protein [Gracilimonas sp.]